MGSCIFNSEREMKRAEALIPDAYELKQRAGKSEGETAKQLGIDVLEFH